MTAKAIKEAPLPLHSIICLSLIILTVICTLPPMTSLDEVASSEIFCATVYKDPESLPSRVLGLIRLLVGMMMMLFNSVLYCIWELGGNDYLLAWIKINSNHIASLWLKIARLRKYIICNLSIMKKFNLTFLYWSTSSCIVYTMVMDSLKSFIYPYRHHTSSSFILPSPIPTSLISYHLYYSHSWCYACFNYCYLCSMAGILEKKGPWGNRTIQTLASFGHAQY